MPIPSTDEYLGTPRLIESGQQKIVSFGNVHTKFDNQDSGCQTEKVLVDKSVNTVLENQKENVLSDSERLRKKLYEKAHKRNNNMNSTLGEGKSTLMSTTD